MTKPKIDLVFNGSDFTSDYLHNGKGECPYCFLGFMHEHIKGYKLNQCIKINLPKQESWEDRFDKTFPIGSFTGSSVNATEIKEFILKEFIV